MDRFMRKAVSPWVDATGNLVPTPLADEAKGEIWSNLICTHDYLSGM